MIRFNLAMLKSSVLPAADVGLVVGVIAAELPPLTEPVAEEVPPTLEAPFAAFSARRFCLDAEGAILCDESVRKGKGGRDGRGCSTNRSKKIAKAAKLSVSRHHTMQRLRVSCPFDESSRS